MKRIVNIKYLTALVVLFIIASSCTKDFEEINTDPNNPSTDLAAPDMLLTNIIESSCDRTHEIFLGHEMGNCWVQHMAKVQYTDEDRYTFRPGVVNNSWSSFYAASGMDAFTMYKVATARQHDNYKGVALVMHVYITSVLTDLFGDIPYTEAWRAGAADGGIVNPKYDSQESIYRTIIKKLDTANQLLTVDGKSIAGDILFDNDILKWKKFSNSMRMRLLMRMSSKDAAYVTTELTKMVADPAKYPVFESNDDNAQLMYLGQAPNNNPITENRKTRDDHRVSKTVIDMMWTNNPNVDYRIALYANKPAAGGWWEGMPNGLTSSKALDYLGGGIAKTSKLGDYFTGRNPANGNYELSVPGVFMSYAELQFILAEGVQRGLITGAPKSAQQYYEAGIFGSYRQYDPDIVAKGLAAGIGVEPNWTADSLAADYLVHGGAAWNASKALEQIGTEKWLATFEQGLQSWFEWRRTGFPVLVAAADGTNSGKIPVRVPYPTDEYATNPTNVAAAVSVQGADDLNTKVWWNK
jgi:hypothetical protein